MTQLLTSQREDEGVFVEWSADTPRPLVSVLVPGARNAAEILDCVAALLAQDYPNLEVLVVDDGTADSCRPVLARIAYTDTRLRVVTLPEPVSHRQALLAAARRATGEIFAIVEPELVLAPDDITRGIAPLCIGEQ